MHHAFLLIFHIQHIWPVRLCQVVILPHLKRWMYQFPRGMWTDTFPLNFSLFCFLPVAFNLSGLYGLVLGDFSLKKKKCPLEDFGRFGVVRVKACAYFTKIFDIVNLQGMNHQRWNLSKFYESCMRISGFCRHNMLCIWISVKYEPARHFIIYPRWNEFNFYESFTRISGLTSRCALH